mgnify:CR=1 FL=1
MRFFKEYCNKKEKDPRFNELYDNYCSLCKLTIHLGSHISLHHMTLEEIAAKAGLPLKVVRDIVEGDACCPESVRILYEFFHLDIVCSCGKIQGDG